jgi:hypothetical protein
LSSSVRVVDSAVEVSTRRTSFIIKPHMQVKSSTERDLNTVSKHRKTSSFGITHMSSINCAWRVRNGLNDTVA